MCFLFELFAIGFVPGFSATSVQCHVIFIFFSFIRGLPLDSEKEKKRGLGTRIDLITIKNGDDKITADMGHDQFFSPLSLIHHIHVIVCS